MTFLQKDNYYSEVENLFLNDKKLDIAVAFLGYDSINLFESKNKKPIKLICNFESGACNPWLIEKLKKEESHNNIELRSNSFLHAKILIQDDSLIIGSANLSANGLSLEGTELTAWTEAGVSIDDKQIIAESKIWFDTVWKSSHPIELDDIRKQKQNWSKRRKERPFVGLDTPNNSLITTALADEQLKDRNIYFAIYSKFASKEAENTFNQEKNEHSEIIDFYEDWLDLPDNAHLISIHIGPRNGVTVEEIYTTPPKPIVCQFIDKDGQESSIKICFLAKDILEFKLTANDKKIIKDNFDKLLKCRKACQSGSAYVVSLNDWITQMKI